MEQEFEILETIKTTNPNPIGYAKLFGDRLVVKSRIPKWREFPAHVLPTGFVDDYERAKHFKVYEDDIWLIGFPRSGTTLMQELLWILVHDFDFMRAITVDTFSRARFFDSWTTMCKMFDGSLDDLDKMARPRILKSHYPVQFLPDQIWTVRPRIIHISRDIKDVAISLYHLRHDVFRDDVGSIEEHFEEMLNDKTWWCPYRQHLSNYQSLPNYENICYVTYEELVSEMEGSIKKLASFLDKDVSDENVNKLVEHLRFKNMKKNKMTNLESQLVDMKTAAQDDPRSDRSTNTFIRKGIVGDHKNCMTEEMIKRFDEWMLDRENIKCPFKRAEDSIRNK